MSTVEDLHNWYRVLFGAPERLGLTQGEPDGGFSRSGRTAGIARAALVRCFIAMLPFQCTRFVSRSNQVQLRLLVSLSHQPPAVAFLQKPWLSWRPRTRTSLGPFMRAEAWASR